MKIEVDGGAVKILDRWSVGLVVLISLLGYLDG